MNKIPRQASLFRVSDTGGQPPPLTGCRCKECGFIMFPPQAYGCERCGTGQDHLEPFDLKGHGVLKSFAIIHGHHFQSENLPTVLGEVILDEGPVVQAMLYCRDESELAIGCSVHSVLLENETDKKGNTVVDCLFTRDKE